MDSPRLAGAAPPPKATATTAYEDMVRALLVERFGRAPSHAEPPPVPRLPGPERRAGRRR